MDWLKELLEKATVTDGKLDTDALMKAISAEFPKHAVPKEDFNNKVKELTTANETIKNLKKDNGDNEELQKKIGDYETEIKNLKKSAEDTTKTYALKEQLAKSGVLDPDYLIYKAGLRLTRITIRSEWTMQSSRTRKIRQWRIFFSRNSRSHPIIRRMVELVETRTHLRKKPIT